MPGPARMLSCVVALPIGVPGCGGVDGPPSPKTSWAERLVSAAPVRAGVGVGVWLAGRGLAVAGAPPARGRVGLAVAAGGAIVAGGVGDRVGVTLRLSGLSRAATVAVAVPKGGKSA